MAKNLSKEYPSDPTAKNFMKDEVVRLCDSLIRMDAENDLMKGIIEDMAEKHGIDKGFMKKQAQLLFDAQYNDGKKAQKIKEAEEELATFEMEMAAKI